MPSASGWSASSPGGSPATPRRCRRTASRSRRPAGKRLLDRVLRQVAPDARPPAGPGRPVRPLAERASGFDYFWGFLGGEVGPVRPGDHREQHRDRRAGGRGLLPPRRDGRQDDRVAPRRAGARPGQAVLHVLLDRVQPRPAPRAERVGRQVQGRVRPGLGQAARGDVRAPEEARRHPGRREADAAARSDARLGLADENQKRSTRARWRSTRATRRTPTGTSAA